MMITEMIIFHLFLAAYSVLATQMVLEYDSDTDEYEHQIVTPLDILLKYDSHAGEMIDML